MQGCKFSGDFLQISFNLKIKISGNFFYEIKFQEILSYTKYRKVHLPIKFFQAFQDILTIVTSIPDVVQLKFCELITEFTDFKHKTKNIANCSLQSTKLL